MTKSFHDRIEIAKTWLKEDVFPLWSTKGIDPDTGCFNEELTSEGEPTKKTRRAMVQARQIYAINEGAKMQVYPAMAATALIDRAARAMMKTYALPSGAFFHAAHIDGTCANDQVDLYTQAFILFGLGNAYEVVKDQAFKGCAIKLVKYLEDERRNPNGGYTEILSGRTCYQSNPHMHLMEAVLFWMHIDSDPVWTLMATQIFELARDKFMKNDINVICERFNEKWEPEVEAGKFVWEPGHQYEWAWLMLQFGELSGVETRPIAQKLFENTERFGVNQQTGFVFDEVWSDLHVKSKSCRFWPQGERIKAAVELGLTANSEDGEICGEAADQGFDSLMKYFEDVTPGLWFDTMTEDGELNKSNAKASSLYHIVNALSEYANKRPILARKNFETEHLI